MKYKVLSEVAKQAFNDTLSEGVLDIPNKIVPGNEATMRCCVYKERAILVERIKLAMGGNKENENVVEVIEIACDECPVGGYEITNACRGCIAHRCEKACKKDAITFDHNQKAHIDKSKCVECGACAKVCPYSAINNYKRPCEKACAVNAITKDDQTIARIDNDKCISCGACVYQCPFGAIMDKSYILDVIKLIKGSENNTKYKVYAIVAPSISSQFTYAKPGQVITGIKNLGFHSVMEVALGADMVAKAETEELLEKGQLTSSCCPSFVEYIHKEFPSLIDKISHNLSPMALLGKCIKDETPDAKVVFIGPCISKKNESKKPEVAPYIDSVITFEELQALLDSQDIDVTKLEESVLEDATSFGRGFAKAGGVAKAIGEGLKLNGDIDFEYKPISCDGLDNCRKVLLRASKGVLDANFIEGMACTGGCVNGAGCLTH